MQRHSNPMVCCIGRAIFCEEKTMTSTDQIVAKAAGMKGSLSALKIRARLNLGFAAMVLIIMTLVGITVFQVSAVSTINTRVVD